MADGLCLDICENITLAQKPSVQSFLIAVVSNTVTRFFLWPSLYCARRRRCLLNSWGFDSYMVAAEL